MKEKFQEIRFSPAKQSIVDVANTIITDYEGQGYKLSLRQLYYQLVARNIVENTEKSYKNVGNIISDARLAGLCDWDMIEDRARQCVTPAHWSSPSEIVKVCARQYREDKWNAQPFYCEVMVEKQALEGVLEPVCNELDISFTANKGYSSQTMMYNAGKRLAYQYAKRVPAKNKKPRIVVFYLGDHDPSGMDMTRDVRDRLLMFSEHIPLEVIRLALNMDQIEELNPPENPAKMSDSRAEDYVAQFGDSSWELDAVAPDQLAELVRNAVSELRDEVLWGRSVDKENTGKERLQRIADNWEDND